VSAETADLETPGGRIDGLTPFQAFQLSRGVAGAVAVPSTDEVVDL
jgi:hypothetical protein